MMADQTIYIAARDIMDVAKIVSKLAVTTPMENLTVGVPRCGELFVTRPAALLGVVPADGDAEDDAG
jgi:hypothetical protein